MQKLRQLVQHLKSQLATQSNAIMLRHLPKKAMKNQKRPASDSDGDTSSDEEPEKRRPHKKTKARHDVEEEEVEELDDNEPEEVEEEDDEEEPEQKTVSYSAALNRVKLT